MLQAPPTPAAGTSLVMSMADIAQLAGVRRPVVTTWRRRHVNFPPPTRDAGSRPLFDARQVCDWLVATGRAEREQVEPELCLYALSAWGPSLPPRELIAAVTALICLHYLDGEPLGEATGVRLRDRAEAADPFDGLLRSEIHELPDDGGPLPQLVDDLIEAAWGCGGAFERVVGARGRLGAVELSAHAVDPQLAALIAGLCGAAERGATSASLVLADPSAGPGDLLAAAAARLPESCSPIVVAAEPDRYLARLLRRRLTVHGVPVEDQNVRVGRELADGADDPDAVITQLPYRPGEQRAPGEVLARIDDVGLRLGRGRVAVVLGPADVLTGDLPRYSADERYRAKLLAGGMVEAVIRLPGGLLPFRPGYETALWVLTSAHAAPVTGRMLLADVSNAPLTAEVCEALVTDVVTWRRGGHRPGAHTLTHCAQTDVRALVESAGPLLARTLPTIRERTREVPAAVARITQLEGTLAALADPKRTRKQSVRTGIVQAPAAAPPDLISVGALLADGLVTLIQGCRIAPADITGEGSHPVLGLGEITGREPRGARLVDRAVLAQRYPRAVLTEPGDVVVTASAEPAVYVDDDGFSVVEFPVRALRIPESKRDRLTPRVLAALLVTAAARRTGSAVRGSRKLEDWRIPALDAQTVRETDGMLAALAARQALARQELDALAEVARTAVAGLGNGTLTFEH